MARQTAAFRPVEPDVGRNPSMEPDSDVTPSRAPMKPLATMKPIEPL